MTPTSRNPLLRNVVASAAALAVLAGGGVVAAGQGTAPVADSADVQLVQASQLQLPELTVGTPFYLDGNKLIADLKVQYGYPQATVTVNDVTGLPPGITWDKATNVISGTPTTAGTYSVTLDARGCVSFFCQAIKRSAPVTVKPGPGGVTTVPGTTTPTTPTTAAPTPTTPAGSGSLGSGSIGDGSSTGSIAALGSLALVGGGIAAAIYLQQPR